MAKVRAVQMVFAIFAVICLAIIGRNMLRKHQRADLLTAAQQGDTARVQELLRGGVPANITNEYGINALILALEAKHIDTARVLLNAGGDPRPVTTKYDPALHVAAALGDEEMVRTMLRRGGNPNARSPLISQQSIPLVEAIERNDLRVARALIEGGARINFWSSDGRTALMEAASKGDQEAVRTLMELGAAVNAGARRRGRLIAHIPGISGSAIPRISDVTPLMRAASNGHREVVEMLLQRGADPNADTDTGETALSLARQGGHADIVALLQQQNISAGTTAARTRTSSPLIAPAKEKK